jgi:hypothetical protein
MSEDVPWGTKKEIDGRLRVYYDGYWVKAYPAPADTLVAKKWLIEALTRRLFNHVEHGLNVPGTRLEEARRAFESESEPQRKRVKAAMLAGALFNRAVGIFTRLVDIQALGVEVQPDDPLMIQCGEHLQEALDLGKLVLHRSGEEGIDELWGEPFKAFAFPIEAFYTSRYIKIAATMRGIETIGEGLTRAFDGHPLFVGIAPLIDQFVIAAKAKCETLRTDEDIFDVWTSFVVAAENLCWFAPNVAEGTPLESAQSAMLGTQLVQKGTDLVTAITRARTPMPKSTAEFVQRCQQYRDTLPDLKPAVVSRSSTRGDAAVPAPDLQTM